VLIDEVLAELAPDPPSFDLVLTAARAFRQTLTDADPHIFEQALDGYPEACRRVEGIRRAEDDFRKMLRPSLSIRPPLLPVGIPTDTVRLLYRAWAGLVRDEGRHGPEDRGQREEWLQLLDELCGPPIPRDAIPTSPVNWSQPQTVKVWATAFDVSRNTMSQYLRQPDQHALRVRRLNRQRYMIDLDTLPATARRRYGGQ
jgi:hypothetical protein